MIFDQPPAELPVATLRPRDTGSQLLLDVRGWFAARWRWLRPRTIPVTVAFAGMLGVLASASYLRELAHRTPEQLPAAVLSTSTSHAGDPMGHIRIVTVPGGAGAYVAKPLTPAIPASACGDPAPVKIEPGVYRIKIEPAAR